MKYDGYVVVDSNGHIRVPEDIKFNDAHKIADVLFQCSGKIIGVKELDVSFQEHDQITGKVKLKGGGTRWNDEQEKFYLENADLDNNTLAEKINERFGTSRSGMAIKMKFDSIVRPFNSWCDEHASELDGMTRKEKIDKYYGDDE